MSIAVQQTSDGDDDDDDDDSNANAPISINQFAPFKHQYKLETINLEMK